MQFCAFKYYYYYYWKNYRAKEVFATRKEYEGLGRVGNP